MCVALKPCMYLSNNTGNFLVWQRVFKTLLNRWHRRFKSLLLSGEKYEACSTCLCILQSLAVQATWLIPHNMLAYC